jgi:hypothetical protein
MGRVETALGVFGVLATALGVGLLFAPDLLEAGPVADLTETAGEAGSTQLLLVLGVVTALLVGAAVWPGSRPAGGTDREFPAVGDRQGSPDGGATGLLGADVESAIREGGSAWQQVRATLADTAMSAYAQREGVSQSEAASAIEQGRWTDDTLAAGVAAGEVPRRSQLRLWLVPERERRRRIERTTAAIERLQHR